MNQFDYGMVMRALLLDESECGDLAIVKEDNQRCFLALLDVLGHGKKARKVAISAKDFIEQNYHKDLVEIMNDLHNHLLGTRGAVAALIRVDMGSGEMSYVGIGNIAVSIFRREQIRLVPKDGVIGYIMPRPVKQVIPLCQKDIIIMFSDGLRQHFNISECRDLFSQPAQKIAEELLNRLWKANDDASCIAFKYIP
ncbi:MAG: protein phosphatase 2C-like protein [Firmicutes bacterium]|nr:protein phosphatase 2C-like protein [Bacillota bacterium]